MTFTRVAAAAAIGATALMTIAPAATAAPVAPKPAAKIWAVGTFTPGKTLDVYGSCADASATRAWVAGPRGMKATLSPMADKGHLGGEIMVPKALQGSWIRLSMWCKDGSVAQVVVRKTGSKPAPTTPAPKPAPTPAPTPAPKPVSKSALKAWTAGSLKPGAKIQVYVQNAKDRRGKAATTATVVGPRAMKATLKPVKGKSYLTGSVVVPKTLKAGWIRLTVVAPNGVYTKVTVKR